jgi:hypothetical protein
VYSRRWQFYFILTGKILKKKFQPRVTDKRRVSKQEDHLLMPKIDPRVDAYIAKSADFAKPILIHLRKLVHEACPDCEETIKWGVPFFDYKGPFCSMAAFKAHCVFGFAKTSLTARSERNIG